MGPPHPSLPMPMKSPLVKTSRTDFLLLLCHILCTGCFQLLRDLYLSQHIEGVLRSARIARATQASMSLRQFQSEEVENQAARRTWKAKNVPSLARRMSGDCSKPRAIFPSIGDGLPVSPSLHDAPAEASQRNEGLR